MTQDKNQQNKPGRKFDQPSTGSNSAGSMGAGGTGSTGERGNAQGGDDGTSQSAGRTDDLLSGGSDANADEAGFAGGQGEADPGMRQSGNPGRSGGQQQK